MHRSGFVNIIGHPNVGKSTLMNALVGENMSIISSKPQTTRHRILGILSGDDFQIVFSDTPGFVVKPSYRMHEKMNAFVAGAFEDADIILFVTTPDDEYHEEDPLMVFIRETDIPAFLVINKADLFDQEKLEACATNWQGIHSFQQTFILSAKDSVSTTPLRDSLLTAMPEGPSWYPKDQLTDRPERFFVSELIREQIFQLYEQEIPYSTEVVVAHYQEPKPDEKDLIRIGADIYVMRESQKGILLGKGGSAIKKLGTQARASIEAFLGEKIYLELHIKVRPKWRDDDRTLKHFGYSM